MALQQREERPGVMVDLKSLCVVDRKEIVDNLVEGMIAIAQLPDSTCGFTDWNRGSTSLIEKKAGFVRESVRFDSDSPTQDTSTHESGRGFVLQSWRGAHRGALTECRRNSLQEAERMQRLRQKRPEQHKRSSLPAFVAKRSQSLVLEVFHRQSRPIDYLSGAGALGAILVLFPYCSKLHFSGSGTMHDSRFPSATRPTRWRTSTRSVGFQR